MDSRRRALVAIGGTAILFILVQAGALALVEPFADAGLQPVENPSDPTNSLLYFGGILVATAVMLGAIRLGFLWVMRGFVLLTGAVLSWYVLAVVLSLTVGGFLGTTVTWGLAAVLATAVAVALYVYPEWYVVDVAGVLMGAGAAGLFGITFGVLPAVLLLTVLAAYDAVSVYGTEHMLTLAEGAMDLRIPVLFIVPTALPYSFLDDGPTEVAANGAGDAPAGEAVFVGLGDAVMPTIMAVSAAFHLGLDRFGGPFLLNLPALCAVVGTLVGLVVLQVLVVRGRAHAGLPLLNGGAIGGYLLGATVAGVSLVDALGLAPYV
jgi:presenilin-like A22 family membrane protease